MQPEKTMLFSIRQRRGQVVNVYDGRKWPVVRCGSVYVTADDTAQHVTSTIITATSIAEKKKRASKYTVAIGTSHGHVQSFLDDSDSVLSALDRCHAEEKCLMLIKRPKQSAKQMLKSHSWANLSVSDSQLYRQLDGSYQTDTRKHKYRWKKKNDQQPIALTSSHVQMTQPHDVAGKENTRKQFREEMEARMFMPISRTNGHLKEQNMKPGHQREINNNHLNKTDPYMYFSCTDITSIPLELDEDEGRIGNDQFYTTDNGKAGPDNLEPVSRAHSLGDLTTGLTLSVVGQRKADSMLNLSVQNTSKKPRNKTPGPKVNNRPRLHSTEINVNEKGRVDQLDPVTERRSEQSPVSEQGRASVSSVASSRGRTPSKTKRSLPHVPVSEATERIKRFTELMKARMALHSSTGRSTASLSSQTPQHSESGKTSLVPETPDHEVLELLQQHQNGDNPQSAKQRQPEYNQNNREFVSGKTQNYAHVKYRHINLTNQNAASVQSLPLSPGDRSSDSGQTTLTSHSHSSTMDSGYTTNNDGECEIYASVVNQSMYPRQRAAHGSQPDRQTLTHRESGEYTYRSSYENCYSNSDVGKAQDNYYHVPHIKSGRIPENSFRPVQETNDYHHSNATGCHTGSENVHNYRYQPIPESSFLQNPNICHSEQVNSGRQNDWQKTMNNNYSYQENDSRWTKQNYQYQKSDSERNQNRYYPTSENSSCRIINTKCTNQESDLIWKQNSQCKTSNSGIKQNGYHQNGVNSSGPRIDSKYSSASRQSRTPKPVKSSPTQYYRQASEPRKNLVYRRSWDPSAMSRAFDNSFNSENGNLANDSYDSLTGDVIQSGKRFQEFCKNSEKIPENRSDSKSSSETYSFGTLPGSWKFQDKVCKSPINNKCPTLFQLSQMYDFFPARLLLSAEVPSQELLTLTETSVDLPGYRESSPKDSGTGSTPKGNYAVLGGPGSAFRPVKIGGGSTFKLISVSQINEDILKQNMFGDIHIGDILVEMNGRLILGADFRIIQKSLDIIQGQITLTVARPKASDTVNGSQPSHEAMQQRVANLEKEMQFMRTEITHRDVRIKELHGMLTWKQRVSPIVDQVIGDRENSEIVISDDEFIV